MSSTHPSTPYHQNAQDYFHRDINSLDAPVPENLERQGSEEEVRSIPVKVRQCSIASQRRVSFFQHCAIVPDPPHLQESKPSIKRFSFANRSFSSSSGSHNPTSSPPSSHRRNKSATLSPQSGFGSTLSPDQPKLGSVSGSAKKSRRTSLDIGGGGGLKISGGSFANQEEPPSGGKWRIKTLNKLGNVIAAATSNANDQNSSEEDPSFSTQDVDAEEFLSTVSFRDEIISKIARGNDVTSNCRLLEEFESGDGRDEGTLKANGGHQITTAKRRKKKPKLKSALKASSQFGDSSMENEGDQSETSSSTHDSTLQHSDTETREERFQRRLSRQLRRNRHDGSGPPIASLLPSASSAVSDSTPASHVFKLSTASGKQLSISLNSGKEELDHITAVETAKRLGGLVIPLETECSCKDCQSRIQIGLEESYQPSWSKAARVKYIAGREQAKILARQRIDAAKRLAEKAEREEELALYHGLGGSGSGTNSLVPSWASPSHPLSPAGSRTGSPQVPKQTLTPEAGDSTQKDKEIPLSTIALAKAAQVSGNQPGSLENPSNHKAFSDGAELTLAASSAIGLKMELDDARIDSNETPEIEGPRPLRSSLDLARPEDGDGDYFNSRGLKAPAMRTNSSTLDASSDQSHLSESASESGPSLVRPSPIRPNGDSSTSSPSASSPVTDSSSRALPSPLAPEAHEIPPLISNPIDDELVDELRALRLKAEEAFRHRAASPRIRSGGARSMMRQLEAAESRESVASIERTRSANSNRRNANISTESYASSNSGWTGISPAPSPRGWDGPGIGRIGSPPIRAWSPSVDPSSPTSPTSPVMRTLSPPFVHRATSPSISRSSSPSSAMMRSSPLGRVSSIPESHSCNQQNDQLHHQGGSRGHSLLRTCQDAADASIEFQPKPPILQRPKARPASAIYDVETSPAQDEKNGSSNGEKTESSIPLPSVVLKSDPASASFEQAAIVSGGTSPDHLSNQQEKVLSKADQLPPQRHQRTKSTSSITPSLYQTHGLVSAFGTQMTSVASNDYSSGSRLQRTSSSNDRKNQIRPKPGRSYSSQNNVSRKDPSPASSPLTATNQSKPYIPSESSPSTSTPNEISKAAKRSISFLKGIFD